MAKSEFRTGRAVQSTELRAIGGRKVRGQAVIYNTLSADKSQVFRPGCFTEALRRCPDIKLTFNHNVNKILGRTKAGTLRIIDTPEALTFEADLPNTEAGRDVFALLIRGDIEGCSISYAEDRQHSTATTIDGQRVREIRRVFWIGDIALATYPKHSEPKAQAIENNGSRMRPIRPECL